jgi:hypothetical protein
MSELLPCPCCGGAANLDQQGKTVYSVGCEDCGLQTSNYCPMDRAILLWNTRPNLPSALPIPAPDPRYDARCALQDKTDWSAS